jgi:integrase
VTAGRKRRGHGEGSIYRRADGLWVGVASTTEASGRRRRRYVYGSTRAKVQEKLGEVRRDLRLGIGAANRTPTVGEYLESWLRTALPGSVRESTALSYADLTRRHIIPAVGGRRLDRLTPADVREFLAAKSKEQSVRGRPLSPRTVQYLHAILRRALEQARREELVHRNVAALVTPPRVVREEVQPLSPDEALRLLEVAKAGRLYALYSVALAIGLRRGEALALRWGEIDFDNATLRVTGSLQRIGGELRLTQPKTARSRRVVPLPDVCVDALRAHRAAQAKERLRAETWADPDLVFTTTKGTPIEPRNLVRHFEALCRRAGVRKIRFHDLRHTCASLLLVQGVEPRVIMETLGHSVIGTTMNLYTHVMPVTQRAAATRMDQLLRGEGS